MTSVPLDPARSKEPDHGQWLMELEDRLVAVEQRADQLDQLIGEVKSLVLKLIAAQSPEVRDDVAYLLTFGEEPVK